MRVLIITQNAARCDKMLRELPPNNNVTHFHVEAPPDLLRGRYFDTVLVELGVVLSPQLEGIVRLCVMAGRTPESRIAELEARVRELEAAK